MAFLLPQHTVFLHVPKTGGEWVRCFLGQQGLILKKFTGHADARTAAIEFDRWFRLTPEGLGKEFCWRLRYPKRPAPCEKPFLFSFVRHPLRWYESMFKYSRKRGWPYHGNQKYSPVSWSALSWLNGIETESFMEYVCEVFRRRPGFLTDLYAEYTGPMVGFVGRTERLTEDLEKIMEKRGIKIDRRLMRKIPPQNVSSQEPLVWDSGVRKEIVLAENSIFQRYGYDPT